MKKNLLSLACAFILLSGLLIPPAGVYAASNPCPDEYTVQNHDTLISIADLCGTTVSNILALNPQIANSNLIYNGQVLRVRGKVIPSYRVTYATTLPTTYTILEGDTFLSIAGQFGTTIWEILQANPNMNYFTRLVPGLKLNIPGSKTTTSFTILKSYVVYYPNPRVTLSAYMGAPGDDIHVYVSGFPEGASIDYVIGESGKSAAFLYDGTVDEDGNASLTFEIPAWAQKERTWIVFVKTTSHKDGVEAAAPLLRITE